MLFLVKQKAAFHAEPIHTYRTTLHGQVVAVRVYAPGASGGRAKLRDDLRERLDEMKAADAADYEPQFELWSLGEDK